MWAEKRRRKACHPLTGGATGHSIATELLIAGRLKEGSDGRPPHHRGVPHALRAASRLGRRTHRNSSISGDFPRGGEGVNRYPERAGSPHASHHPQKTVEVALS